MTSDNTTQKRVSDLEDKVATLEALVDRFIPVDDEGEYTKEFKNKLEQSWKEKESGDLQPLK